ncbi:hypothetical protein ACLMJK_000883 [Lecanora helva]
MESHALKVADDVPEIRVRADTQSRDDSYGHDAMASMTLRERVSRKKDAPSNASDVAETRMYTNGKHNSTKLIPTLPGNQANTTSRSANTDGRPELQAIDPLSHQILKRTNTNLQPHKVRTGASSEEESVTPETGASVASGRTSSELAVGKGESGNKDKRNRVSFFSRFAPKKKDALPEIRDDDSEMGDRRAEGMDADVFSQPIGYVPQFPSPPKYIKVRSHGKKEKDFNRVFLAQELRGRSGVEIAQSGGRLVKNGALRHREKDGNAIWAMEFSKDGKHLAAGGKDFIVRVWQVISTKEERHARDTEEDGSAKGGERVRLSAPVFKPMTVREYEGHEASILDLNWSKNNFLLSSSMDKTVRLWHLSQEQCLCSFKHSDFVTSIRFHPRDDRFFLAGSLDSKLRLWSIPDKSVAYYTQTSDLITAVAFSPDGKTAIAGCLTGLCLFYETEGLKSQTQLHVRSAHGKNAKGSKITGIQAMNAPPEDPNGEVKLLITSNDSRVRVYNLRDKGLELKLKGNENSCSQIHACFSDDAKYIICGSEDRKVYIWSTGQLESEKDKRPMEMFEAHSAIVTTAIMAPIRTKQLLSASGDPLYDLCNPPPVTLISRSQSQTSSMPPTEDGRTPDPSIPVTAATPEFNKATKPEESPAYLARRAHPDGNIIVTADFAGHIKVFRQDCAYQNRLRNNENGAFSKKMLGRTNSVATKHSGRSRRNSLQANHPSSDRILSWRQSINSTEASLDNSRLKHQRSSSPRKSSFQSSARHPSQQSTTVSTPSLVTRSSQPSPHLSSDELKSQPTDPTSAMHKADPTMQADDHTTDPLMLQGEQSYMFWDQSVYQAQAANQIHLDAIRQPTHHGQQKVNGYSQNTSTAASSNVSLEGHHSHLGIPLKKQTTAVSRLSSEEESEDNGNPLENEAKEVVCNNCAGRSFKAKTAGRKPIFECENCGEAVQ